MPFKKKWFLFLTSTLIACLFSVRTSIADDQASRHTANFTDHAAISSSVEEDIYFMDDEMVTGATKREVKLKEAPANVTVITNEDIIESGATNLGEVFRRVPGMDVITLTPADTQVSARGFATPLSYGDRMAVLIDGRTFYLEFLGGTLWAQFPVPLADIKQIEVIKGPMSSLYGNRALLGVINIVTYKPEETKTMLSGGGGRFRYAEGNFINAGKFAEGYWYKVSGTYHRQNDYSNPTGGGRMKDRDDFTAAGQFDFNPLDTTNINLWGSITKSDDRIQLGGLEAANDTRGVLDGQLNQDFGRWGKLHARSYWERHDMDIENFYDVGVIDLVDAEARYYIPVDVTDRIINTTTFGFEYRYVGGDNPVIPTINNFAGYLQNETKFYDLVILTGGVRIDNQKDFAGTNVSAQGNLVFLIHPRYTLRTGVASAFNAPTIMNYVGRLNAAPMPPFTTVQLVGNRNLTAERILYFELGNTIHPTDWLKLRADFFYYRLNKMIDATATIPNPTTLVISYTNDGGAEAIGGEISAEAEICSWLTGFGYWAYEDFDAINGNLSPAGNLGNPKNKVGAGLSGKWLERITANLEFYYVQKRSMEAGVVYNPTFPVSSVGDIYLLNARVGVWPIKEHLELSVSANNILNDNTTQIPPQDLFGIPLAEQPQFMIWGALKYVF